MSGPDKVFAITKAIIATAEKDGIVADAKILGDVALDVDQAAYRAIEPDFGHAIVALAASISAGPEVAVAAELVGAIVQKEADKLAA